MVITIHQPEHLPCLGLIDKINQAQTFVVLDNVQYCRRHWHNRNRIRSNSPEGFTWLTVPIKKADYYAKINEIEISDQPWQEKYLNVIKSNYGKSPFLKYYLEKISTIINGKNRMLIALNMALIKFLLAEFGVNTKIAYAAELKLPKNSKGNETIFAICQTLKADRYISVSGGREYLKIEEFKNAGIEVVFNDFENKHPAYQQQYDKFMPLMSSLDLLLNYGGQET